MEDFIGIIIYLLLAVIGILASVYRQKNRQKSVKAPPVESASTPVDMGRAEDYESEFDPFAGLFEEKATVTEAEVVVAEDENKTEEVTKEEVVDIKDYFEGEPAFSETKETRISDDLLYELPGIYAETEQEGELTITGEEISAITEHPESEEEIEKFDIKKAIIYSEILKRNEY